MARQGVNLKGVASFHGSLTAVKPAQRGGIKAKILVLHGGDDKFLTPEQVKAFKQEMKDAGADLKFISYPGALHGFTNPDADRYAKEFNLPLGYNAEADQKSWQELRIFLRTSLRNGEKSTPWNRGAGRIARFCLFLLSDCGKHSQ
jgi:dienelactone hydrolase